MYQQNTKLAIRRSARMPLFFPAAMMAILAAMIAFRGEARAAYAEESLESLAKPQEGRSMRATSTMRVGEVRARRRR